MTARPLTVIPLKFTGVPITQLDKKINVKKYFLDFLDTLNFFLLHKNVFKKFNSKHLLIKIFFKCNL
jgi:hypothetical protein